MHAVKRVKQSDMLKAKAEQALIKAHILDNDIEALKKIEPYKLRDYSFLYLIIEQDNLELFKFFIETIQCPLSVPDKDYDWRNHAWYFTDDEAYIRENGTEAVQFSEDDEDWEDFCYECYYNHAFLDAAEKGSKNILAWLLTYKSNFLKLNEITRLAGMMASEQVGPIVVNWIVQNDDAIVAKVLFKNRSVNKNQSWQQEEKDIDVIAESLPDLLKGALAKPAPNLLTAFIRYAPEMLSKVDGGVEEEGIITPVYDEAPTDSPLKLTLFPYTYAVNGTEHSSITDKSIQTLKEMTESSADFRDFLIKKIGNDLESLKFVCDKILSKPLQLKELISIFEKALGNEDQDTLNWILPLLEGEAKSRCSVYNKLVEAYQKNIKSCINPAIIKMVDDFLVKLENHLVKDEAPKFNATILYDYFGYPAIPENSGTPDYQTGQGVSLSDRNGFWYRATVTMQQPRACIQLRERKESGPAHGDGLPIYHYKASGSR